MKNCLVKSANLKQPDKQASKNSILVQPTVCELPCIFLAKMDFFINGLQ